MAKRKRRSSKRQSSAALRRNGLNALKGGDYDRAISTWERVARQTPSMQPSAALAEAYFRRGLKHLHSKSPDPQAGLNDLQKAAESQPADPRFAYHLGLAMHRQGESEAAIPFYRKARQDGGKFADRAAYPLALALLQCGQDPAAEPFWSDLPAEERAMLSQADAFRRRPYAVSPDVPLLWHGLASLDAGYREQAAAYLDQVLEKSDSGEAGAAEKAVAHYYLGVLAAQAEDGDQARDQWDAARAAGYQSPRLGANLGELYHRLAEEWLVGGDLEGAQLAAQESLLYKPDDKRLKKLMAQVHQRLANQAADAGWWETAHKHWQTAVEMGGGSFRLAYNLALARERAEDFVAAGETWREALRRRPRRTDHPDAINDEQVARLWQRAAEAYRQAGEYDEAIHVYKQAVKWNPDNADIRMALAEGLLENGQGQAAENELNRILERDPDNVSVLLRLGEVITEGRSWWQQSAALRCWDRVLELQPENRDARQLLADFYQNQAEAAESWSNYPRAVEMYRKALGYLPQNGQLLAALGGAHFRMGNKTAGQVYMDEALENANAHLDTFGAIIRVWLEEKDTNEAWKVMAQAEAAVASIPHAFYLAQASYCLENDRREMAGPWLERTIEKAPPDALVLLMIGEMATMAGDAEIGRQYLEQAIAAGQNPAQAYLLLGVLAAQGNNMRAAKKHWRYAERAARRERDLEMVEHVRMTRTFFSQPRGLMSLLMGGGVGPFGDLLDDDEFDDDDYW